MDRQPRTLGEATPAASTRGSASASIDSKSAGQARWFPALLGVVAGVVLCGGTLFFARLLSPAPLPAPTSVEASICADLIGQHYEAFYVLLAPNLAAQGNEQQFAATQRELDVLDGPVTACVVTSTNITGENASLNLRLTRTEGGIESVPMSLVVVDGQWFISTYDTSELYHSTGLPG